MAVAVRNVDFHIKAMHLSRMAEVTYTDLSKYVIIHMVKWTDPRSGKINRMEFRYIELRHPGMGCYVERRLNGWGPVFMSIRELQDLANIWKNDVECNIPQQVVDELINPTYEVVLQFQENEGDDRHLVEIRKYANDDHQLWRDRHLLKRLNSEEFAMELQLKQQWEDERMVETERTSGSKVGGLGILLSALVKYAE
jgi:hypothetical protein